MSITAAQYARARVSVTATFFAMGVGVMAAATRFAEIKAQIGANDDLFGYALAFGTIGGITGNLTSGRFISRLGTRRTILIGATGMPIVTAGYGYATNAVMLGTFVLLSAFFYATANIAMNAQGVDIESHLGQAVMPSLHAAWSFGSLTASILGNFTANFLDPAPHLTFNALISLAISWYFSRNLLRVDPLAHLDDNPKPLGKAGHRMLFFLALGLSLGVITEVSSNDWSAIHLHETLGVPLGLNGLGVTVFLFAQLITRSFGNRLTDRFGSFRLLLFGGTAGALVYLSAVLVAPLFTSEMAMLVHLAGIAALGVGVAGVPAAFTSSVARLTEVSSARAIRSLMLYTSFMFLVLRPTVSFLVGTFGTTTTLAITAVSLLVSAQLSRVLKPTQPL